ncbi:enoyl-CoA hydratase/isomerase family protein [Vineibacter terrae]|uniref:Enoyl-CoA hydratase/isomerase family protein n=2 Tax=Vineibacter terrae TaxID=2586908 RepID=A0A5C8PBM8_9HYPH|nr:enoyl-CoA hydratase/isomerase family protein [Vineibacter terrae]
MPPKIAGHGARKGRGLNDMTTATAPVQLLIAEGIATVTLNRPKEMNSFDGVTAQAILETVARVAGDAAVRVVVIAANGPAFSAGGDFNWVLSWPGLSAAERQQGAQVMTEVVQAIYDLPKPTIARVQGAAVGGGVGVMLACDYAVAAETARFGLTSVRNGLLAGIAIPALIQAVGPRRARQLLMHGGLFPAAEALAMGLVDRVVPADRLDEAVAALARELTLGAPDVQALVKRLVTRIDAMPTDGAVVDLIAGHVAAQCVTDEAREGMSAFLAKRKPRWAT